MAPWKPHLGRQLEFLRDRSTEVLFGGANGGGKSSCLLYKGLYPMQLVQGRTLILRATYPQLKELMNRAVVAFQGRAKWLKSDKLFEFPVTGGIATYEFGYGQTEDELFRQYDGQEFDFIGVDEAGYLKTEKCLDLLRSRLRTKDPRLFVQLALTANPGQPLHAVLKKRYVDATLNGLRPDVWTDPETGYEITRNYIPATVEDNPTVMATNPGYIANLNRLPEQLRKQRRDGDWTAADGLAFGELDEFVHVDPPTAVPSWWTRWGALDWGFRHWTVVMDLACDEQGTVHLIDTLWLRRLQPQQLAETIWERMPVQLWRTIYAGHDLWHEHRAHGYEGPAIAEQFHSAHLPCIKADIDRKQGFSALRDRINYRGRARDQSDSVPTLRLMKTPGNLRVLTQLQSLIHDPDNPEDVLKVDADPNGDHTDVSGDDAYDCLRMGLLSFIRAGKSPEQDVSPFDPVSLGFVAKQDRITRPPPPALTTSLEGTDWW